MRKIAVVLGVGFAVLGVGGCTVTVTTGDVDGGTSSASGSGSNTTSASVTTTSTGTTSTTATGTTSTSSTVGSGGSGAGGAGGAGGYSGAGGYADAGWEGGADGSRCIDDSSDAGDMPNPDICGNISAFKNITCQDAMGMYEPPGLTLCNEMQQDARPGAFQVFYDCINAQSKTISPCVDVNGVSDVCTDNAHWPVDCQVGKVMITGTSTLWDCTNLVAKCSTITQTQCDYIMNVFNDSGRSAIYSCYLSKFNSNGASNCQNDFLDCVSDPAHQP